MDSQKQPLVGIKNTETQDSEDCTETYTVVYGNVRGSV